MMLRCLTWIWMMALQTLGFAPALHAVDSVSRECADALEFRRIFGWPCGSGSFCRILQFWTARWQDSRLSQMSFCSSV